VALMTGDDATNNLGFLDIVLCRIQLKKTSNNNEEIDDDGGEDNNNNNNQFYHLYAG
jgi:hypothetical protein